MLPSLREPRHWGHDLRDPYPRRGDGAVPEGIVDETAGFVPVQVFGSDDALELTLLASRQERSPLCIDLGLGRHGGDELLDQVLLVPQRGAGIDRPVDRCKDLLVLTGSLGSQVALHQH